MIFNFDTDAANQLLTNPRLPETEKLIFLELKTVFEKEYGIKNYFLVPSSGSSKKADESIKLIALHRDAVLNSAQRFNDYFKVTKADQWGIALPPFHVASLGTYARAYLSEARVVENSLSDLQTSLISMVPAQIFDLVTQSQTAPKNLRYVFVGAGALNSEIKAKAIGLGWPIIETYGMTETASMIAVKQDDILRPLPGVKVETEDGFLKICANSLLTCYLQKQGSSIILSKPVKEAWFQTEDRAKITKQSNDVQIYLSGRSSDYVKILGEGVSLLELTDRLIAISLKLHFHPHSLALVHVPNVRSGAQLILVVENSVNSAIIDQLLTEFNLNARPYEKIRKNIRVEKIPLSDLGKVRTQELTEIVYKKLQAEKNMKKYEIPWEVGSVFICTKCGAKYNEGDLAEDAKKQIRKELKEKDANKKIRVMTSGCLNICYPEEQTFVFMPNDGPTEVYTTELDLKTAVEDISKLVNKKL